MTARSFRDYGSIRKDVPCVQTTRTIFEVMAAKSELQIKRIKIDAAPYSSVESCNRQISQLRDSVNEKLSAIELNVKKVANTCVLISNKVTSIENALRDQQNQRHPCCQDVLEMLKSIKQDIASSFNNANNTFTTSSQKNSNDSAPVVLVPTPYGEMSQVEANVSIDSRMQVITLNKEEDYPDGSWLGNENNSESRVRVPISPMDLIHINGYCSTPEKMALVLLDYLFPRDVLAVSNLSGKGKHGKKQLSPLMIYGIRCHLVHKFKITEKDWYRIKQNMDSKCRTAWRKKSHGLPLGGFKHHDLEEGEDDEESTEEIQEVGSVIVSTSNIDEGGSISLDPETLQLIQNGQGDSIKVLTTSSEHLAKYQQVVQNDQLLPVWALQDGSGILTTDSNGELFVTDPDSLSIGEHPTLALVTNNGEILMERSNPIIELADDSVDSSGDI
ncbi:protein BANP-like isoform X2 [Neocloeon triangulifer]|uniref:protein BANP-like isoform X2 n=1 Tax=Neocloeon triangulifer TaxID=2078957 RepID=UPI00286F706F|nr:protein BANP-like isoform X2 [Neocloeon triangulifer]